jgi:hypothetical protein
LEIAFSLQAMEMILIPVTRLKGEVGRSAVTNSSAFASRAAAICKASRAAQPKLSSDLQCFGSNHLTIFNPLADAVEIFIVKLQL